MSLAEQRGSKRSGPALNALALVVLVVILGLVALVTKPPTPPSVAEFAPQSVDLVKDAPGSQSSQFGGTGSGGEGGTADPGGTGGPPDVSIDAARVKRCVGSPPRQIEDPQSPPCADYWQGDNGGATARGVTRDEIRVVTTANDLQLFDEPGWADFFSKRFEFYGRKLKVYSLQGCSTSEAAKAQQEIQAFALTGCDTSNAKEFTRRGIISTVYRNSILREQPDYLPARPHLWGYLPSMDRAQRNLGEFMCASLAGRVARHAGPGTLGLQRAFGIALGVQGSDVEDASILVDRLDACSAPAKVITEVKEGSQNAATIAQDQRAAVGKFKQEGITSVICLCNGATVVGLQRAAIEAGYNPEWLTTGTHLQDEEVAWQYVQGRADHLAWREQRARTFGLATIGKSLPLADRPWYWAYREANPDKDDSRFTGGDRAEFQNSWMRKYSQMLLLASGIQQAGPRLTPETFEAGLMKTKFPNPGAGAIPYFQGAVGFTAGDYTMVDDYGLVWWSDSHESKNYAGSQPLGTFCFVHQGKRFSEGKWPKVEHPFFDAAQGCH